MKQLPFSHAPLSFRFQQTPRDFVVQENPLYAFSGEGEHCVIAVRKKGLSTMEMIQILSEVLGCKIREIGYAGLKDKNALTTQFFSLPYSLHAKLLDSQSLLLERQIKILHTHRHNNKLRIGHLKSNTFFIRLKKLLPSDFPKAQSILEKISLEGMPNYFGYQRFGKFGDNYLEGKKLLCSPKRLRNKTMREFLISAYQSHLFNQWLSERIKLSKLAMCFDKKELALALKESFPTLAFDSKNTELLTQQPQFFKLLRGEMLHHYPYGKLFAMQDSEKFSLYQRFASKDISPCGMLYGKKLTLPSSMAWEFQKAFVDFQIQENGSYRFAWVFPENLQYNYIAEKAHLELTFTLPKGSYATTLLEVLANAPLTPHQGE